MNGKPNQGNVLSEYGIVIGLIALLCIGAVTLLRDSISDQLNVANQGETQSAMEKMSRLDFKGSVTVPTNAGTIGLTAQGANNVSRLALNGTSSGQVNATVTEGEKMVAQLVKVAQKMEKYAEITSDPALQEWYMDMADRLYQLSSAEATYEMLHGKQKAKTADSAIYQSLAQGVDSYQDPVEAKANIQELHRRVYEQREKLFQMYGQTLNKSADARVASNLVDQITTPTEGYYKLNMNAWQTIPPKSVYEPNVASVRQVAGDVVATMQPAQAPPLYATLNGGLTMDTKAATSTATSTAQLQSLKTP